LSESEFPTESKPTTLVRVLGPWIAIAVVVGSVIGSGIFLKPGNIAAESGNFWLILSMWCVGGVLCVLGGLCFAELAAMLPQAGGLYVYLREAYGRPVAFLYGWNETLFGRPAAIGALAVAFVGSLSLALRWRPSVIVEVGMAIGLILAMAVVNILGVIWGGRLQMVVTLIKAGFLALLALSPLLLIPFVDSTFDLANYSSSATPRQTGLAGQLGVVLLSVMWAYNNWHAVTPLAEEIRDPHRNIPLALLGGIGILIVLYIAVNVAYHGVLSMEEMQAAGDHAAEHMLEKLLGQTGLTLMSAVVMCSVFGAINTSLLQGPRIMFAMGRDGVFFRSLGQVHARFRSPVASILAMATMAMVMIVAIAVAKHSVTSTESVAEAVLVEPPEQFVPRIVSSLKNDSMFGLLSNFVIFAASIFYVLGVLAVIVLRLRRPDLDRPYKTWGYPIVPLLFIGVYVWFLRQIYLDKPLESHAGLAIIALGLPVYWVYRWRTQRGIDDGVDSTVSTTKDP